jgi:hypothetical protein
MVLSLFLFMGFQISDPKLFGIVGTRKQFEAFNHFWRLIGHLLGVEDRFSCCGETLEDTLERLDAIKANFMRPGLQFPNKNFESYTRLAFEGIWHISVDFHYESILFTAKRACKVPGYHYYFDNEITNKEKEENRQIFENYSFYARLRIFIKFFVYEMLSPHLIFRWVFNFIRLLLGIFDLYPFMALISFGRKYAFVKIFKDEK